ncbi:MAG TPA: hypothetical protein VGD21_06845 [Lysobacter sp.]
MINRIGLLVLLGVAWFAAPAKAAESYDNCTGFIESLPATISTQGTWCLRKHLYTSMTSGAAITVATDNVTIDCNNFRVSGLGAGAVTYASGIANNRDQWDSTLQRNNTIVRRCRIQGFAYGANLYGAGVLVENNRFDHNQGGINVIGTGSSSACWIRGNFVNDGSEGIRGYRCNVQDNTVSNITGNSDYYQTPVIGIYVADGIVQGNRINGLLNTNLADGWTVGIKMASGGIVRRNTLTNAISVRGQGIRGGTICRENDIQGYSNAFEFECEFSYGNTHQP